jgi:SAM-dependent methyltransferase
MRTFIQEYINHFRINQRVNRNVSKLPIITAVDELITSYINGQEDTVSIDLGCGEKPRNPFQSKAIYGIDFFEDASKGILSADLAVEAIPFNNNQIDYITAFDFIEHIPRVAYTPNRRFPFVDLLNEVWRVLKPGGLFLSSTPIYPFVEAFQDPTHVNIITSNTLEHYFCLQTLAAKMYGFKGSFAMECQALNRCHLISLMRKVGV